MERETEKSKDGHFSDGFWKGLGQGTGILMALAGGVLAFKKVKSMIEEAGGWEDEDEEEEDEEEEDDGKVVPIGR